MSLRIPPPRILSFFREPIQAFIAKASNAWDEVPFQITSYWRDPYLNQRVGGHPYSQHLVGLALDAQPFSGDLRNLEVAFQNQGLKTVVYQSHVHTQFWKAGTLERILTGG
jgi:hypothetical protein